MEDIFWVDDERTKSQVAKAEQLKCFSKMQRMKHKEMHIPKFG